MRIAICDNNSLDRELAVELLTNYFERKYINIDFTEYSNGTNLIYDIEDNINFDIVFLEIYIKEINGIEIAEKLGKIHFNGKIVFLTSTPDFVFSGYDVGAVDYLLKNKDIKIFNDIVNKNIINNNFVNNYDILCKISENFIKEDINYKHLYDITKEVLKNWDTESINDLFKPKNIKQLYEIINLILKSYSSIELQFLEEHSMEKFERSMNRILRSYNVNVYHIKYRNQFITIPYYNIIYVESNNSKCIMHSIDGNKYTIYKKLDEIEIELNCKQFLRCHKSYLVNMNYIRQVDKQFIMSNGDCVSIRQRNIKTIRDKYLNYINNKK